MINFHNTIFDSSDDVIHHHLHSTPSLFPSLGKNVCALFNIDDVDRMLTIQGIAHPSIFLMNRKRGIKKFPSYPYTETFLRIHSPIKTIQQFIREGTSILLHDLQNHHPAISRLHTSMKRQFKYLDKTVCFLSPPRSQATRPHCDSHPNIVLQLSGYKKWFVWDHVPFEDLKLATSVKDMEDLLERKAAFQKPIIEVTLTPGDVLFVPQRFLHTATTLDQHSLSIVFQIRCCNPQQVCEHAFEKFAAVQAEEFVSVI
jgi:ribosomal protein L16 Arg81 hydroxylase